MTKDEEAEIRSLAGAMREFGVQPLFADVCANPNCRTVGATNDWNPDAGAYQMICRCGEAGPVGECAEDSRALFMAMLQYKAAKAAG